MSRAAIERAAGLGQGGLAGVNAGVQGDTTGAGDTGGAGSSGGTVTAGSATGGASVGSAGAAAAAATGPGGGGGGGGVSAARLSPVKLGHVGTYSGLLGAIFAAGLPAIQAWGKWVNAHGGLNGHPVQITTADDGGDPSRNLQLTRNMVENQGVIAFVGNIVPLSLAGSQSYLEQSGIPSVGGDLANMLWWGSPIFFPQGGTVVGGTDGSAVVAVQRGGPNVALLYCGEAAGCFSARDEFKNGAAERAGGHLVYSAQVSLAQPNFTSECLQMSSKHVQAAVIAADGNSLSRVARDCKQQGFTPRWVTFGIALVTSIASDPNLEGMVGVSNVFPWFLTSGPASAYGQAMATYAGNVTTSGAAADVWSAGVLLQDASKSLPAGTVKSSDVLNGLYSLQGDTLGGLGPPLTFHRGQPAPLIPCYVTIDMHGGHFGAPNGVNESC
jgi:branched-chain amino acid transport system substrate-binding protein